MESKIKKIQNQEFGRVKIVTKRAYCYPYKEGCPLTKAKEKPVVEANKKGILGAYAAGRMIGAVRYEIRPNRELYFYHLAVMKRWRKNGVGSALVRAVEKVAKARNCRLVTLFCLLEKRLPPFYERLGYKQKNTKKLGRFQAVFMEKLV
jgi:GNAT superfamily N-acetyltransferase